MTQRKLTKEEIEKTKNYSIVDGSSYNVMYGFGEQYIPAFALRLGATDSQVGVLASIPSFIGSCFQLLGAKLTEKYKNRKMMVASSVLMHALMYIPLFIIPFFTKNILYLTIIFSIYFIFANLGNPAWNSWMGDVVTEEERAEYFSKRNKIAIGVLFIAVLFAGIILNYFSQVNIWLGFGILFSIALIGRLVSAYFLSRQFEPEYRSVSVHYPFKEFFSNLTTTNFGKFVVFRSLISFAVTIGTPFFTVLTLKYLGFSYIQYSAILLLPMIVKFFTFKYWGKYARRFGNKKVMFVSATIISFVPLWWFFAGIVKSPNIVFGLLLFSESLSGFVWAGFDLTTFNYMLETESSDRRARAFAYFNVVNGTFVMLGGVIGSILVNKLSEFNIFGITVSAILFVFALSFLTRFIVTSFYVNRLKDVVIKESVSEKKLFFDMLIAKPLNAVLHGTQSVMIHAERAVGPIVEEAIVHLDKGFERIEPLRKSIEPKVIREKKKEHYRHLVEHEYNKRLSKYYMKTRKRKL